MRSGFESRAAHESEALEERLHAAVVLCGRQHCDEEAWEAVVQVFLAQGEHSLAAVGAGSDHAAFAEDAEVVGEGCLREAELEGAARALVALCELSDDLQACRVAQRV